MMIETAALFFYGAIIRRKQNASTNRKKCKEEL